MNQINELYRHLNINGFYKILSSLCQFLKFSQRYLINCFWSNWINMTSNLHWWHDYIRLHLFYPVKYCYYTKSCSQNQKESFDFIAVDWTKSKRNFRRPFFWVRGLFFVVVCFDYIVLYFFCYMHLMNSFSYFIIFCYNSW